MSIRVVTFSGLLGAATASATAATTGGRCRLIVATAATRTATAAATVNRTATAAATVNRAAGGAACVAVTHEVHAEVGEVAQVTCESVASTGAGNDDAAVA